MSSRVQAQAGIRLEFVEILVLAFELKRGRVKKKCQQTQAPPL
jgi:hypothetical protein